MMGVRSLRIVNLACVFALMVCIECSPGEKNDLSGNKQITPVRITGDDLLQFLPSYKLRPNAAKFQFGDAKVAYRFVSEANWHKNNKTGSTVINVQGRIVPPKHELIVLALPMKPHYDKKRGPGYWHPLQIRFGTRRFNKTNAGGAVLSTSQTGFTHYCKQEFPDGDKTPGAGSGFSQSYRKHAKPITVRIGQIATIWQTVISDTRVRSVPGPSPHFTGTFDKLPPLPAIGKRDNNVSRITLQVMFMDSEWNEKTKQVKAFLE